MNLVRKVIGIFRDLLTDRHPPPSTFASSKVKNKSKRRSGTKQIIQGMIALVLIDVKGRRLSSMNRCAKKKEKPKFLKPIISKMTKQLPGKQLSAASDGGINCCCSKVVGRVEAMFDSEYIRAKKVIIS